MGELLLCHETIASMPYYAETAGINIYSMEELCYYIAGNCYLLDKSFMNEELCTWIEKQMKRYKLADRLRNLMRDSGKLSDFVMAILEDCAYCTPPEIQKILTSIRQMEGKSDFECSKLRADQLVKRGKYLAAIYEYKRLLDAPESKKENALMRGNIWHNLGTAYAQLFLFEEAADCYERAYELNESGESLREWLMCCQCMGDEETFSRVAEEHHLDNMGMQEIKNEISIAGKSEELSAFEDRLEALHSQMDGPGKKEARAEINDIIFRWKEEYRRSCKV